MPMFDEKHVKINGCTVVWDSVTRPEQNESGTKYGLKVVVHPNNPDLPLLENLINEQLRVGVFKGQLPNGGTLPLGKATAHEFNGMFNGWTVFNAGTYRGVPDLYDENGAPLDKMQIGNMLYPGQQVDLLVHCYENNKKVKGIALGLDGFAIIASANAPRQNFGSAGVDTSGAFGGGGNNQNNGGQQPGGGYQQNNNQNQNQNQNNGGGYQQNDQQNNNQNQNNGGGYQQNDQQNNNQNQNQNQNNGGPQQNHNYMPPNNN